MKLLNSISIENLHRSTKFVILTMGFLLFSGSVKLLAQQWTATAEEKEHAYEHLAKLHEGTLIVILKTNIKKETALQKVIDSPTATASQKKKATKQLKKSSKEKEDFHKGLTKAFNSLYTFSDVVFVYDHDLAEFKDGNEALLVNENLEYLTDAKVKTDGYRYYAKEEYTNPQEGARVLSYVVYTAQNEVMKFPFPTVKLTNLGPVLLIRAITKESEYRSPFQIVERFDYLLKHRMASIKEDLVHIPQGE